MEKKKAKMSLLLKVLLGVVAGIVCGVFLPEAINRVLVTASNLFTQYLGFIIPLMILAFVTMGIADLKSGAGALLAITVGLSYVSTLLAGSLAYVTAVGLFPKFISADSVAQITDAASRTLKPYFEIKLPALLDTISAVVLAFVLGLCLSITGAKEKNSVLYRGMDEFSKYVNLVLEKTIIPLIPFYVMGTFANMTYSGQTVAIIRILWRVFLIVLILHTLYLLLQFAIAAIVSKQNIFSLIKKQVPGYLTAIGTQSSAATIPVNLKCAESMGISEGIRNFTVPLCANVHMSGSMITIVCCSVAVLLMNKIPFTFGTMFPFMCTLAIAMVASPGAPGGSIMTALPFLPMVGITSGTLQSLMVSLYIAQDSFGTACNVSGDNALGLWVDTIHKKKQKKQNPQKTED